MDEYSHNLEKNLEDLETEVETLNEMINELLRRVSKEKERGLQTLPEVEEWISMAEETESKATSLLDESISKCHDLSTYDDCSKVSESTLHYSEMVCMTLKEVKALRCKGVFKVLVEGAPLSYVKKMLRLQPIDSGEMLPEEAWVFFQKIVGETTLKSHPDIPQLASIVCRECRGFPIALSLIGETMSRKRTVREWHHAIHVLVSSTTEVSSTEDELLPILKFTYDNLHGESIRSCFLYCALFPKSCDISKQDLVDCWIAEGFIEEEDREIAEIKGSEVIADLVMLRLLIDDESGHGVKMHDMVHEMALWIASDCGRQKENFVVVSGEDRHQMPEVNDWSNVIRMSVTSTHVDKISDSHHCPQLTTLFLQENNLKWVSGDFFGWMTSLVVLNLSRNRELSELPEEVSSLVSLRLLNLSWTKIKRLPLGLRELKRLIHLDLDDTPRLLEVDVIRILLNLQVLRLVRSVPMDLSLMEDIQLLKSLKELNLTVREVDVLKRLQSIHPLASCIRHLHLTGITINDGGTLLPNSMSSLRKLDIEMCDIPEITVNWRSTVQRERVHFGNIPLLQNVHTVTLSSCNGLRDLTWLILAPNLGNLRLHECQQIERIINKEKATDGMTEQPFQNLTSLSLDSLPQLESIYWAPLPFPVLKDLCIRGCPKLRRLPFNSNSAKENQVRLDLDQEWIKGIEWEDEATKQHFSYFYNRDIPTMSEEQTMDSLASELQPIEEIVLVETPERGKSSTANSITDFDDRRLMAGTLLSFGVERLWNLLVRETERFQGVKEQFDGLKKDLEMLRFFLDDAEAEKHTSEVVRETIKDIKEIVFDAEDIIETFLLKKELRESSSSRNIMKRLAYVTVKHGGLAFDMKTIRKRTYRVIFSMQMFSVLKVSSKKEYTQFLQKNQRKMRPTFSRDDEDHLVGLKGNVEKLVGFLVEEDSSQVVSIIGMGGIGKTTLARQVLNHETIKSHFPRLVWVCVSQQFERKFVWQTILRQLRPECEVSTMMEDQLQEKIVRVLETQKALIVIDDIWRERDWDRIKDVFLPKKGWKVLLTSRNEEVALHADSQCLIFKPECLTFEESWDLFQRIAFPMKDTSQFKINEDMKEIGKEMIKHCGGLPLALKVLGCLLGKKNALHEWVRIYANIASNMVGGGFEYNIYHVLCLGFEELPVYLKHCFLWLAHFPEDYEISVSGLSHYWAAEGIPRPRYYDGASIRDVGDGYIDELVKRNMVISKRDVKTSRFKTCQLHDMMREVCLRKAEEENFLQVVQGTSTANSIPSCKSRRLSVVCWPADTFDIDTEVKNPSLRTLLFIESERRKATSLFFKRHKLMRVLDLSYVEFEGDRVPSSIGKLIHLRYLSLKWAKITQLPSSMGNLKQLMYLNLRGDFPVYVPNILKEMRELTYLYLPKLHEKTKLELGNLVKLETLKNFSTEHGSVRDLQAMTRLRTLSIYTGDKGCSMETLSSSLSKIKHLEKLTIDDNKLSTHANDEEGLVWDFVHLKQLKLNIYMPKLPVEKHFPAQLTTISLTNCRLKEDPMPILEKLLHLKIVRLWDGSFSGSRMICSTGGFPQLLELQFVGLEEWEEWIVEEGSMPLLYTLFIDYCPELKELPDGLRFITSLKVVNFNLNAR